MISLELLLVDLCLGRTTKHVTVYGGTIYGSMTVSSFWIKTLPNIIHIITSDLTAKYTMVNTILMILVHY